MLSTHIIHYLPFAMFEKRSSLVMQNIMQNINCTYNNVKSCCEHNVSSVAPILFPRQVMSIIWVIVDSRSQHCRFSYQDVKSLMIRIEERNRVNVKHWPTSTKALESQTPIQIRARFDAPASRSTSAENNSRFDIVRKRPTEFPISKTGRDIYESSLEITSHSARGISGEMSRRNIPVGGAHVRNEETHRLSLVGEHGDDLSGRPG